MQDYSNYLAQNKSSVITGTQASRPTTTTSGTLFKSTDGYYDSIYNGASWDTYVNGFKCSSPPAAETFTAVSVTNSIFVDDIDGLILTQSGTGSGSGADTIYVKSAPVSPYRFEVGIQVSYVWNANHSHFGIVLTNGTASPAVIAFLSGNGSAPCLGSTKYSSPGFWNGDYSFSYPSSFGVVSGLFFIRFRDDSVNRYWEHSVNGVVWNLWHQTSRTDYFTPTHVGVYVGQGGSGDALAADKIRVSIKILHWYLGT
jgi:hypothetical protein